MNKSEKPEHAEIKLIPGTNYIILPDQRVARLLKPTKQNDKLFYNLIIKGDYIRVSADKLNDIK